MKTYNKISEWVDLQLANGKYTFPLSYLQSSMPHKSHVSIKQALKRLVDKNKIISVYKGFYIIIPPSYANMGILPPAMFMDDLMQYLNRPYYISLLSAAALHGAAHQQPQSHFVCTILPSMRATNKNEMHIRYVSKRTFPDSHIQQQKSESGFVNVSDPVLTCLDLINYYKIIGGFNRAASVIHELAEEIEGQQLSPEILHLAPRSDIQRLGYLWEFECEQVDLANDLFHLLREASVSLKPNKLNPSLKLDKQSSKNRWKMNINTKIEIDA